MLERAIHEAYFFDQLESPSVEEAIARAHVLRKQLTLSYLAYAKDCRLAREWDEHGEYFPDIEKNLAEMTERSDRAMKNLIGKLGVLLKYARGGYPLHMYIAQGEMGWT